MKTIWTLFFGFALLGISSTPSVAQEFGEDPTQFLVNILDNCQWYSCLPNAEQIGHKIKDFQAQSPNRVAHLTQLHEKTLKSLSDGENRLQELAQSFQKLPEIAKFYGENSKKLGQAISQFKEDHEKEFALIVPQAPIVNILDRLRTLKLDYEKRLAVQPDIEAAGLLETRCHSLFKAIANHIMDYSFVGRPIDYGHLVREFVEPDPAGKLLSTQSFNFPGIDESAGQSTRYLGRIWFSAEIYHKYKEEREKNWDNSGDEVDPTFVPYFLVDDSALFRTMGEKLIDKEGVLNIVSTKRWSCGFVSEPEFTRKSFTFKYEFCDGGAFYSILEQSLAPLIFWVLSHPEDTRPKIKTSDVPSKIER